MKVCVVTVYNSENCGSILQAYALGEKIKALGHEVCYLQRDIKGTGASTKAVMKIIAKAIGTGNFGNVPLKLKFHWQCREDQKRFRVITPEEARDVDCFVLGSDTIWKLGNEYFYKHLNRYWGLDLPAGKCISYAPSVDGTPEDMYAKEPRVKQALEQMQAISVRDTYSRNTLAPLTKKPIELVCDPTMLHTRDFYQRIQRDCTEENFILLYAFRDFCTKKQREDIIRYAKKTGKKLVSFGVYRKWCDVSVPFDAFVMPAYFEKADCVITNTFHGTVFSLIYGKRFANYAVKSSKVVELLRQFDCEMQMVKAENPVDAVLERQMDRIHIQKCLVQQRESSGDYLTRALNGCRGGRDE